MTTRSFWREAWAVDAALRVDAVEDSREATTSVAVALRDDLTIQRYVFNHRRFTGSSWLPVFRRERLFDAPPRVETVDGGGLRAQGWPILTYLREVGPSDPVLSAEILEGVRSENWWVISDSLAAAVELPSPHGTRAMLSLLKQWSQSALQWTQPEVLARVLGRLADDPNGTDALVEALFRIGIRFIDDRANQYDLDEILPLVEKRIEEDRASELADAVEAVLTYKSASANWHTFGRTLDSAGAPEDPVDTLTRVWCDAIEVELSARGPFPPFQRAIKLVVAPDPLLRQMGYRALGRSISLDRSESHAAAVLTHIAERQDLTTRYEELPELLSLFGRQFDALERKSQAELIQRLVDQAESAERSERTFARDWLNALKSHLSARELVVLDELRSDLGEPREEFSRPVAIATWSSPQSLIAYDELLSMPLADLLGHLRHVPIETESDWPLRGGSLEGFAQMLQPLLRDRIADLCFHLGALAEAAEYSSLIFYMAWGLRDVFGRAAERQPERLDPLVDFISVAIRRTKSGAIRAGNDRAGRDDQVERSLADLAEATGAWLAESSRSTEVLAALSWLLESDDPPNSGAADDSSDPPTRAINSVRGEAVLASLRILSEFWGDNARPPSELSAGVEQLLMSNVADERSTAVLSSYGRYLAAIVVHWRDFFDHNEARLLPAAEDAVTRWSAVFGTYLMFYGPHRPTAQVLQEHYELAITRLPEIPHTFLGKHAERLLMHLVALALPRSDDSPVWRDRLVRALSVGTAEVNTRAIHDLAFAVEREGVEVPIDWTVSFVSDRAEALTSSELAARQPGRERKPRQSNEAGALLELMFANRVPVVQGVGLVRTLVALGARPRIDEVIDYLETADPEHTQSGGTVLLLAVENNPMDGFLTKVDEAKSMVRSYAVAHRELAWSILEVLGAQGVFAFEDVAREIAPLS